MASKGKLDYYLWTPLLLVLLALTTYLIFQVAGKRGERQPNVLLITLDSLRHDHLGCSGYERAHTPNIDALAQDGVVFREALAQGTYTRISVPSLITGKLPFFVGIRTFRGNLDSSHTTVAEVLSADGYATLATNRMWSQSFYQGFDETGGSNEQTMWRTARAIQGLEEYRNRNFFIWLYYWDPHAPYTPPEEFMRLFEPDYSRFSARERAARKKGDLRDATGHFDGSIATLLKMGSGEIKPTSLDKQHLIDLYNAEISFVDVGIGQVMAKLKELGLYDQTLIILNADHGEAFGEHGKYYHGSTVYDEMARIPLIIKPPYSRNTNKVVWGQVRNIDVVPTILNYCGLETPKECNGQSLRPFIEGEATPDLPCLTETTVGRKTHLVAFRFGGHKLIYGLDHDRVWLFDLHKDPAERNSLLHDSAAIESGPDEASSAGRKIEQQMRRDLLDLLNLQQLSELGLSEEQLREIDAKTKERLKALGYVY
jgi:arylsulfatase